MEVVSDGVASLVAEPVAIQDQAPGQDVTEGLPAGSVVSGELRFYEVGNWVCVSV